MKRFQHHPDGHVIVENEEAVYVATLVVFAADLSAAGLGAYSGLPAGQRSEVYIADLVDHPDERVKTKTPKMHAGFTGDTQHAPALKRALLDTYIAAAGKLLAVHAERERAALEERRAAVAAEVARNQQAAAAAVAASEGGFSSVVPVLLVLALAVLALLIPDAWAIVDAKKIAEIRANGSESILDFLTRLPASFEAQVVYGLAGSALIGSLSSWLWKWSQGQSTGRGHFTGRYVVGQLLWIVGGSLGAVATVSFQTPSGEFFGWLSVISTGFLGGFSGDLKVKESRSVWTDEQRAAEATKT